MFENHERWAGERFFFYNNYIRYLLSLLKYYGYGQMGSSDFFLVLLGFENSKCGIGNRSRFKGFSYWDLGERWDGMARCLMC